MTDKNRKKEGQNPLLVCKICSFLKRHDYLLTNFQAGDSLHLGVGIRSKIHFSPQRNASQGTNLRIRYKVNEVTSVLCAIFAEVKASHMGFNLGYDHQFH